MRFIAYLLRRVLVLCCLTTFLVGAEGFSQEHPNLILTKAGVEKIRAELGSIPIFDATLKQVKEEVDAEIAMGIHTPIPKDYSGGYTHERHKRNFIILKE